MFLSRWPGLVAGHFDSIVMLTLTMRTDLFDFELPPDRIALRPAQPRDSAKLLVVRPGQPLEDRIVRDLPDLLRAGDQLVVNDTKVIAAQLAGRRLGGAQEARVDVTLIKRLDGSRWQALVKGARKLAVGDMVRFGSEGRVCLLGQLDARVEDKGEAGEVTFAVHVPRPRARSGHRRSRRAAAAALYRAASGRPTSATPPIIKRCLRRTKARLPRPRPACISPTGFWRR